MDEKYKVVYRFKFRYQDHVQEFDSLTDAIAKFNEVLYAGRVVSYIKLLWGDTAIQYYDF